MAQISLNLPVIGNANATEDPKVRTALSDIQTAVNALDNNNIASNADINGSKLLNASIAAAKLASDSVETAKIVNDAVTNDKIADDAVDTAQIADGAVETAQINDAAVTTAKLAASTTGTAVNSAAVDLGTVTARKFAGGLVLLSGSVLRTSGTWSAGDTIVTLPEGFRPSAEQHIVGFTALDEIRTLTITTAGVIKIRSGTLGGSAAASVGFDGLVFYLG